MNAAGGADRDRPARVAPILVRTDHPLCAVACIMPCRRRSAPASWSILITLAIRPTNPIGAMRPLALPVGPEYERDGRLCSGFASQRSFWRLASSCTWPASSPRVRLGPSDNAWCQSPAVRLNTMRRSSRAPSSLTELSATVAIRRQLRRFDDQITWATAMRTAPGLACVIPVGYSVNRRIAPKQ
jgi:hypothetical protein